MAKSALILGKGGAGKTFLASHLAMAFGYLGIKTLLVGCDQKPDAARSVTADTSLPLMQALEGSDFDYRAVKPAAVVLPVSEYVDVLELGPSQLLVGHYGSVLDEAFHYFRVHGLLDRYRQVIFDVTDERWDGTLAPLLRRVPWAVAVTGESPESLFVLNRLLRATLIGGHEYGYPLTVVGAVNNRSRDPTAFDRYIERTRCFPLLAVPELPQLEHLRPHHRTLFALKSLPPELERILDGLVKIADLMRGEPMNLNPISPLPDGEIWELAPAVSLPN